MANASKKQLKLLSLFSGCGGMDLGFEGAFTTFSKSLPKDSSYIDMHLSDTLLRLKKTNFQIVFANDIFPAAYRAWTHNFKKFGYNPNIFHQESVVDLVKRHQRGIPVFPEKVDIVIGGFPCQDFSVAGKRGGFNSAKDHTGKLFVDDVISEESRGSLYYWMKEVIDITKPKMFIAENVKGLTNLGDVKDIIQKDFSSADNDGYFVFPPKILHVANFGVPQSRERVFFVGVKKSALKAEVLRLFSEGNIPEELSPYPSPTHRYNVPNYTLSPPVLLRDIFEGLEEPNDSKDFSQQHYSKAKFMGTN